MRRGSIGGIRGGRGFRGRGVFRGSSRGGRFVAREKDPKAVYMTFPEVIESVAAKKILEACKDASSFRFGKVCYISFDTAEEATALMKRASESTFGGLKPVVDNHFLYQPKNIAEKRTSDETAEEPVTKKAKDDEKAENEEEDEKDDAVKEGEEEEDNEEKEDEAADAEEDDNDEADEYVNEEEAADDAEEENGNEEQEADEDIEGDEDEEMIDDEAVDYDE